MFDILSFKVFKCMGDPNSHNSKSCPFHHHNFDRRRAPDSYVPEPCEFEFLLEHSEDQPYVGLRCPLGDGCGKCHNLVELLYHPLNYKRRLCNESLSCPRGAFCAFAHSRFELENHTVVYSEQEEAAPTAEFFVHRFKTQWCPRDGVHDWNACPYAHTKSDLRRTPSVGYGIKRCPDWDWAVASESKNTPSLTYDDCCPRGVGCPMAHGSKEVLFHPQMYKTQFCTSGSRCQGPRRFNCAFAHGPSERQSSAQSYYDKSRSTCPTALMHEQPLFFFPPPFRAFKEKKVRALPVPLTPSPEFGHRQILSNVVVWQGWVNVNQDQVQQEVPQVCALSPASHCVEEYGTDQSTGLSSSPRSISLGAEQESSDSELSLLNDGKSVDADEQCVDCPTLRQLPLHTGPFPVCREMYPWRRDALLRQERCNNVAQRETKSEKIPADTAIQVLPNISWADESCFDHLLCLDDAKSRDAREAEQETLKIFL